MGTTLSDLKPPRGAKTAPKRVGRGHGSGLGTSAGKGMKGQRARSGVNRSAWFEGGQMPIERRLPKRGFKNIFRVTFYPVNVGALGEVYKAGDTVDVPSLKVKGLVPRKAVRVKVLADGELAVALKIKVQAFSAKAQEKITAVGGSIEATN